MAFTVIIPARLGSTRLPNKPLLPIHGKPMICHVIDKAIQSGADRVIVATDSTDIKTAAHNTGAETCLTAASHVSGTDRLSEVVSQLNLPDDMIIVNVQGDEPLMPPRYIKQAALLCEQDKTCVGTLASPITSLEVLFDPSIVKVVLRKDNAALYFSRSPVPWVRDQFNLQTVNDHSFLVLAGQSAPLAPCFYRHLGIYAYRASFLRQWAEYKPCPLETAEMLEQLRVLWYGRVIQVTVVEKETQGVDTMSDLEKVTKAFFDQ